MLEKKTSGMTVLEADMESIEYQNLNIYRYIHLNDVVSDWPFNMFHDILKGCIIQSFG